MIYVKLTSPTFSVKSFSLMSGTIRSHLAVPSVSALTAGLASLMAVLHLLETSDKEIETSAATVVGKELILWLDDIARHIEQTANGNPSVGLLDLLDLSSRWIAQRGQISKASVPRHTKQSFIALAEMVAKFKDGAPGEGSCETARDRWSGFTPIGSLAAGSAEENAVKLRDPSVADLIRRIENTRTFLVSTLQPVVPITTSVQTQPRLASASPAPVSSPRTAPAQRPKPSAVEEDDEEEIVLFKGRSSTKPPIAPTARMGSPGMGSRTIGSPIAQIVAAGTGGSPNLAPVTPPPGKDRASPKPAAIGSERRPPSTNKSPVLLPVEGAAPYAAYVQAPAPQMPANADHQLRLESWKTGEPVEEDVEARRREILLRDLMNPLGADSERFDGANRRDSRRAMSPFPNVPGPLGPAPGTPEQAAAPMETDVGPGKGGVGDEDELMSMNMMQFLGLELDTVPKVPRASSLLGMSAGTSGGAPGAPPGLGLGAPAPAPAPANTSMAAPGFGLPIAAPPPDFLDANSAVLLSFFRQQQQETAQRQLADQLRWQQNQLAGLGSVTDFASPFANFGTAHGLPGVGNFGWPDQGHLQAGASNVASAQMAQLSMLGLSPAQIQLLLQTGWQPPINNG